MKPADEELWLALRAGRPPADIERLLAAGADPDASLGSLWGNGGENPTVLLGALRILGCKPEDLETIRLLAKASKLHPGSCMKESAAGWAGSEEMCKVLAECGAPFFSASWGTGNCMMHKLARFCRSGDWGWIENAWHAQGGADLSLLDEEGNSALMQAAKWDNIPFMLLLAKLGADLNEGCSEPGAFGYYGRSPLASAAIGRRGAGFKRWTKKSLAEFAALMRPEVSEGSMRAAAKAIERMAGMQSPFGTCEDFVAFCLEQRSLNEARALAPAKRGARKIPGKKPGL